MHRPNYFPWSDDRMQKMMALKVHLVRFWPFRAWICQIAVGNNHIKSYQTLSKRQCSIEFLEFMYRKMHNTQLTKRWPTPYMIRPLQVYWELPSKQHIYWVEYHFVRCFNFNPTLDYLHRVQQVINCCWFVTDCLSLKSLATIVVATLCPSCPLAAVWKKVGRGVRKCPSIQLLRALVVGEAMPTPDW